MRTAYIAYAAVIALGLASPAMAQSVTIQGPNPGAATASQQDANQARVDQHLNARDARIDQNMARRDAAHGNYVGAAQAQQDARQNMQDAHRDGAIANQDANRARNQDSVKIGITP